MAKPPIKYHPQDIAKGIGLLSQISDMQIANGTHPGMLATLGQPAPMEEHHCISCGEKRQFQVEGEETMDNGALRRYGTCPECGNRMSKFAKGAQPKGKKSGTG